MKLGGFSDIPSDSSDARWAWSFLSGFFLVERPGLRLITLLKAERQPVAGLKIRVTGSYTPAPGKDLKALRAVVYRDAAGKAEVLGVEWDFRE